MTQNLPPPIPSLIPETAPFSEEQRAWLNGFFAGLVSLDGFGVTPLSSEQAADLIGGASAKSKDDDDGEAPLVRLCRGLRVKTTDKWSADRAL